MALLAKLINLYLAIMALLTKRINLYLALWQW